MLATASWLQAGIHRVAATFRIRLAPQCKRAPTVGGRTGGQCRRLGGRLRAQPFRWASATSVSDRAISTYPGGSGARLPAKPITTVHLGVPRGPKPAATGKGAGTDRSRHLLSALSAPSALPL